MRTLPFFMLLALPAQAFAFDVYICHADSSYYGDAEGKIAADPRVTSVTSENCGAVTPAIETLRLYDVVLFWSNSGFSSDIDLGNVLADYVDEGYPAVEAVFSVADNIKVEGRFLDEGYRAMTSGTQTGCSGGLVETMPGHAILDGVSSFDGGSSGYCGSAAAPQLGADLVAEWGSGEALIATHVPSGAGTVVAVNFFPPSSDARSDFWDSSTDGIQILVNAMDYAISGGGPGLDPTLTLTGDCPGSVNFDLTGATPGGNVAFMVGRADGSAAVPFGPCAGTETGLDVVRFRGFSAADGGGNMNFDVTMPDGACDRPIQFLDMSSCEVTNVDSASSAPPEPYGFSSVDWVLQAGTIGQYTMCESVTDGGTTCNNPEIRYGSVEGGIPNDHGGNDYTAWCTQLGFSGFDNVVFGSRSCDAPQGQLFGCTSYDEGVWHWCDWSDGYWFDESLDYHDCPAGDQITSITCTP